MKFLRKYLLLTATVSAALVIAGCKEEPNPKAMAQNEASAVAPDEDAPVKSKIKAKVRKSVGETELSKNQGETWKRLITGQKVVENNRIRTAVESEAVLAVEDGSSLWITERSDVTLTVEMLDSLNKRISIKIENGQVRFDVQKQVDGNTMEFRTGTAVAAIRGTAGFVGAVNGKMVASLKEGRIDVTDNKSGKVESITANQTVVVDEKQGVVKMDLGASGTGALSKTLDSLLAAAPEADVAKELSAVLKKFDASYKERRAAFEKNLRFQASALPAEVFFPNVTLQARVNPGVIVTVLGEVDTVGANGVYQRTFEWGDDAYGTKRFLASCSDGDVEIPCFMWTTNYVAPTAQGEPAAEQPAAEPAAETAKPAAQSQAAPAAKDVKLSVKFGGARSERVHHTGEYTANMKVNLSGITAGDLGQIKSIVLKRKGAVVETVNANAINSLSYEFSAKIPQNTIANFEVVVTTQNGKTYSAKKTYEVYCNPRNHQGGENLVSLEEEYDMVKQRGMLKEE